LNVFVEEKIIDKVEEVPHTEPYKKLKLSRIGCDNHVLIVTDGSSAVVEGFNYLIVSGLQEPYRKVYFGIQADDFKWDILSVDVLDQIHSVIYERKEVVESKLKNALSEV